MSSDSKTNQEFIPMVLLMSTTIQKVHFNGQPVLCLLDSGATSSWIARKRLPKGVFGKTVQMVSNQTMAGTFSSNRQIKLEGVLFPEFFWMWRLDNIEARIFNSNCHYDMIIGRDVLNTLGISMDFAKKEITWDKTVVSMCSFPHTDEDDLPITQQLLHDFLDEGYEDDDIDKSEREMSDDEPQHDEDIQVAEEQEGNKGYKSKVIKESKYEAAELEEVCWKYMHLSLTQQNELLEVLFRYPTLFNGKLKKCSHFQVHLELQANAIPHSGKAYDIPYCHCEVFKNELKCLIHIRVLEKALHSEWLAQTFIQPKKDGHVHCVQILAKRVQKSNCDGRPSGHRS